MSPNLLFIRFFGWSAVWRRNFRVWRTMWLTSLMFHFGEPLFIMITFGYGLGSMIGQVGQMPYTTYIATGMVCSSAMMASSFEAMYSSYARKKEQRTWYAMMATPLNITNIVVGEIMWASTKGLTSAIAMMIVASVLGFIQWQMILFALPIVFIMNIFFSSCGLIMVSFATGFNFFVFFSTLIATPMMMLGGVFFPIDNLPDILQNIVRLLPLTNAVEIIRAIVTASQQMSFMTFILLFSQMCVFTFVTLGFAVYSNAKKI